MNKTVKNFNLCIERKTAEDSFTAVVRDDETNILAASEFRYRLDASVLTTLEDSVGKNIHRNAELIKGFGSRLFDAVFKGAVSACYQSLRNADIRMKLRFEKNERELLRIPWEFLFDGEHFLSAGRSMTMTRVLEGAPCRKKKKIEGRLKMLTVVSSPLDLPEVYHPHVEKERGIIRRALSFAHAPEMIEMDFLDKASIGNIRKRLKEGKYHILHFTGHGIYSRREQQCYVLLEDEFAGARRVDNDTFADLLSKQPSLRLVVLSGFQTTIAVGHRVLGDIPALLLLKRIPAAIAMQYSVTGRSAANLKREFYARICDGSSIDLALTSARRALLAAGNEGLVDFGTPVLYSDEADCLLTGKKRSRLEGDEAVPMGPRQSKS